MTKTIVTAYGDRITLPQARERTPEEQQARTELCTTLDEQVRTAVLDVRRAWWALAKALREFHNEHAWTTIGFETLDDYLASPEVQISRSTFFRLTEAYRVFASRGVAPARLELLEVAKVSEVLPALAQSRVTVDQALADAGSLSRRDLRAKYGAKPVGESGDITTSPSADADDGESMDVHTSPSVDEPAQAANSDVTISVDDWTMELAVQEGLRALATGEDVPASIVGR